MDISYASRDVVRNFLREGGGIFKLYLKLIVNFNASKNSRYKKLFKVGIRTPRYTSV